MRLPEVRSCPLVPVQARGALLEVRKVHGAGEHEEHGAIQMTLDKTTIRDLGDRWDIRRNEDYSLLTMFAKNAETEGVRVTPAINPARTPDVLPGRIEYAKSLGDMQHILDTAVPAIIEKQRECDICKDAKEKVDRLIKGDAKPEELVEDANANPGEVGLLRGIVKTFTETIPRPSKIFPKLSDLRQKKLD